MGYAGSKLLFYDRCGAKLHGLRTGRNGSRTYGCSRRKLHGDCAATYASAEDVDEQLGAMVAGFAPPLAVKREILRRIRMHQGANKPDGVAQRTKLLRRRDRLKKLYLWDDISEGKYLLECQLIDAELMALEPPVAVDVAHAADVLTDFKLFWEREKNPHERNRVLRLIIKAAYVLVGRVVRIEPKEPFQPYFEVQTTKRE